MNFGLFFPAKGQQNTSIGLANTNPGPTYTDCGQLFPCPIAENNCPRIIHVENVDTFA